jgi:hypothetical protein
MITVLRQHVLADFSDVSTGLARHHPQPLPAGRLTRRA